MREDVCICVWLYMCVANVDAPLAADSRLSPPGDEAAPHRHDTAQTKKTKVR